MNSKNPNGVLFQHRRLQGTSPQIIVECNGIHALCIFELCDTNGICNCRIYNKPSRVYSRLFYITLQNIIRYGY